MVSLGVEELPLLPSGIHTSSQDRGRRGSLAHLGKPVRVLEASGQLFVAAPREVLKSSLGSVHLESCLGHFHSVTL